MSKQTKVNTQLILQLEHDMVEKTLSSFLWTAPNTIEDQAKCAFRIAGIHETINAMLAEIEVKVG